MPITCKPKPAPLKLGESRLAKLLNSLRNTSDAEFLATAAEHRRALKDRIDRRTTGAMLGITVRTLDRWHDHHYGPQASTHTSDPLQQSRNRGMGRQAGSG